MEGAEPQPVHKCWRSFPKLWLWILEHVWAHKRTDLREVLDPSTWPEMDCQPLSLEDSWRLRVASAQAYSIVKNRDIKSFERVMGFLEDTYRLLPRLVPPIKHMKIVFGLKTMSIMWMLRERKGLVDTMFKINQFFPSKLPQYQGQCNQREMFLMRKNHADFKSVAQTLAMDRAKLEDYITNQMEERYGDHYAQKVEDRLLHYLNELEAVLPGDTHIDKLLKKKSPVTEEEKLLLEVVTSDCVTIGTTLKKLLHCDIVSCGLDSSAQSPEHGKNRTGNPSLSKVLLQTVEGETHRVLQPQVDQDVCQSSSVLSEDERSPHVSRHQQTEDDGEVEARLEKEGSNRMGEEMEEIRLGGDKSPQERTSSPQFCSKHQRWVKSILQNCSDESDGPLLQTNTSPSPLLFHSSSTTTSSPDFTPSGLIPHQPGQQHPPARTCNQLRPIAKGCEKTYPKEKPSSGSADDASQRDSLLRPSSSRESLLPTVESPVVCLVDIASSKGTYHPFTPHQASPNDLNTSKQAASACHTSRCNAIIQGKTGDTGVLKNPLIATDQEQTAPPSTSVSSQPPTRRSFSNLLRKFTRVCPTKRHSQALEGTNSAAEQFEMDPTDFMTCSTSSRDNLSVSGPLARDASTCTSQSWTRCPAHPISPSTDSSQSSVKHYHQPQSISPLQAASPTCSIASLFSNSTDMTDRSETSGVQRPQLKLSLPCQALLLQSKLLQPYVSLTRLSSQQRSSEPVGQGSSDDQDRGNVEEEPACSFDPNTLYSSYSSSSGGEDSLDSDPDYKPHIKKKKLLLEYEAARTYI